MTLKTAIILAAGLGSRLSDLHPDLPKALFEIDGETLLTRSLRLLSEAGIERTVVVAGHRGDALHALVADHPGLEVVNNLDYIHNGSMASLACALEQVTEDFLLLESDLYYEPRALHTLLALDVRDAILCSGKTHAGDEVYVEAPLGRLRAMSKRPTDLTFLSGELVGISRLSHETAEAMLSAFVAFQRERGHARMDYETGALVEVAKTRSISVVVVPDLLWGEIDDARHLARVRELVPAMRTRRSPPSTRRREILLNPGPATTSQTVKEALLIPDVCPREADFCALAERTRTRLAALAGDVRQLRGVLVMGSGTTALEAMLTSFVDHDARLLVLDNGDYGARLADIARTHDLTFETLTVGFAQAFDLTELETRLSSGRFQFLTFVHHETSSGMLNPLEDITRIARRHGVRVLVDAMSSFGATPLLVGEAGVDAVTASANKCLHGMAGLSFVIATRALLERPATPRVYSLDLRLEHRHVEATGQSRFTLSPQLVSALSTALDELEQVTLLGRYAQYQARMRQLISGLMALGFAPVLPEAAQSHVLVCVKPPAGFDFARVHDALRKRGFTIYPGKPSAPGTFRLSVLGDLSISDVDRFLKELATSIAQ